MPRVAPVSGRSDLPAPYHQVVVNEGVVARAGSGR